MIQRLSADGRPHVHLDLGNWANTQAHVDKMVTEFMWETMEELDITATTPGPRELAQWPLYKKFLQEGTIPVVSSNLTYVEGGEEKPVGDPYLIVERNGVKVGLLALIGGNAFTSARIPEGVEVRFQDPIERGRELVQKMRDEGAEVVALMSQMSTADTEEAIREISGIDVAFFGNLSPWKQIAEDYESTITNKTGMRGQYLGQLTLIVDPEGNVIDWGSQNAPLLAETFGEDVDMAASVAEMEAEMQRVREEQVQARREVHTGGGEE